MYTRRNTIRTDSLNSCILKIIKNLENRFQDFPVKVLVCSMCVLSDESCLVLGDTRGGLHIMDFSTSVINDLNSPHTGPVKSILLIENQEFISGGEDGKVLIWKDNNVVFELQTESPVISLGIEGQTLWITNSTDILTQYKISDFKLENEEKIVLNVSSATILEAFRSEKDVCIGLYTPSSIEILNITKLATFESHEVEDIKAVSLFFELKCIVYHGKSSKINIWNYEMETCKSFIDSKGDWNCLTKIGELEVVSIGTIDGKFCMKIWNVKEMFQIFSYDLNSVPLMMTVGKLKRYLYVYSENATINRIKLKENILLDTIKHHSAINDFQVFEDNLIFVSEKTLEFKDQCWNFESSIDCCILGEGTLYLAQGTNVKATSIDKLDHFELLVQSRIPIKSIDISNSHQFLSVVARKDKRSEIIVYDLTQRSEIKRVRLEEIVHQAKVIKSKIIFSTDNELKILELDPDEDPLKFETFAKIELKFCVNFEETLLFCAGNNCIVDIINLNFESDENSDILRVVESSINIQGKKKDLIKSILDFNNRKEVVSAISLNSAETFIIISKLNEGLQFLSIADRTIIWTYNIQDYFIQKIICVELKIYLKCTDKVLIIRDPTYSKERNQENTFSDNNSEDFCILGPDSCNLHFLGMIRALMDKETLNEFYDKSLNEWIVFPKCINAFHIFAHFEDQNLIKNAYSTDCPFIRMSNGLSPLSIALRLKSKELVENVISGLLELSKNDKKVLSRIENDLIELNYASPPSLSNIYGAAFLIVSQAGLKNYGLLKDFEGVVVSSDSCLINQELFIKPSSDLKENENAESIINKNEEEINLIYRVSAFRMILSLGSHESIYLLQSLVECSDDDVFKTQLIKALIQFKWKSLRIYMVMHELTYLLFTFFTLLSVHSYKIFAILSFFLNSILLVVEALQLSTGYKFYFKNWWNNFDLIRILLVYYFLIIKYFELELNDIFVFHIVALILIRGLSYFEIFAETRTMIKTLKQVTKDIIPFLLLFVFVSISFMFFFIVANTNQDAEIWNSFQETYNLNFGNFNTGNYNFYQFIWFHLCTLFGPLFMFNLFVSIMNETFSDLEKNSVTEDIRALAELVIEYESMLFWGKKEIKREFLQSCFPEVDEEQYVDKRRAKLKRMSSEMEMLNNRITYLVKDCKTKNENYVNKISKIRCEQINCLKRINKEENLLRGTIPYTNG